jgi:protein-S-isoprenylcysteine O-methyltransferase Ste14
MTAQVKNDTRASAASVVAHLRSLARLEQELARAELRRRGAPTAGGIAAIVGGALLAFFVVALGLATVVAALALVLEVWLALLVAFAALALLVGGLVAVGASLLRRRGSLVPEHTLDEARRTLEILRGAHDN